MLSSGNVSFYVGPSHNKNQPFYVTGLKNALKIHGILFSLSLFPDQCWRQEKRVTSDSFGRVVERQTNV